MRKHDAAAEGRPWWALWTFLLTAPLYLLAAHFGYEDRAYVACIFTISVGGAAWLNRNSRRHAMFWIATAVLVVVHIALVMLLPWPTWKVSGAAFTPFGFIDLFGNSVVIRWLLRASDRQREASAS